MTSVSAQVGAKFANAPSQAVAQESSQRCSVFIADLGGDGIDVEAAAMEQRLRPFDAQILKVGKRRLAEHGFATARAILPAEVRETVKLYLDGKIDQWFSLQGKAGVAFILNVTDTAAAHEMLEKLPLGQAHLMSFELIPLAPLNPLRQLQGMTTNSP
jgi:hypothetical protein